MVPRRRVPLSPCFTIDCGEYPSLLPAAPASKNPAGRRWRSARGAEKWAAIACYRSAGFEIYALDPRALKVGETYFDELMMFIRF